MIALLDVNVLIALFDPSHVHHEFAHEWFSREQPGGWATCPLTENGFVRVASHPAYSGRRISVADGMERLTALGDIEGHVFWPDTASLSDRSLFRSRHIGGHRQLTVAYLLALVVENGGRLATFDRKIPRAAIPATRAKHLHVIGS